MNAYFVVVVLAGCFAASSALSKQEIRESLMKIGLECAEQSKPGPEDIEKMMRHELPTSPEGKCTLACVHKKLGIQDEKTGAYSVEGMKTHFSKAKEHFSKDMMDKADKLADDCKAEVTEKNECEVAYQVANCCLKGTKEVGFDMQEFLNSD